MATSKIPAADIPNGVWSDTDFDNIELSHNMEMWLINDNTATYTNAPTGFGGRGVILGFRPVNGVFLIMLYDSLSGKAWIRIKWWTYWNTWSAVA